MNEKISHGYGDNQTLDVKNLVNDKYAKYLKLKKSVKKIRQRNRISELALPKYNYCQPKIAFRNKFKPHIHIINLDVRSRTRLNQLAFPRVRNLLETRDTYQSFYHETRYSHLNRLIRKSLFSQYSRLANIQAPKKPFRSRVWSKKDWRKHIRVLKRLSKPKPTFLPEKIKSHSVPLEELLPRIKKLCKSKKFFLPAVTPPQKKKPNINRIFKLAKPKEFNLNLYIKPEPIPIDRNKSFKATKRTLKLAEPKDRSAAESDMKDNPFKVSQNALKFKFKEKSRLANLSKPKEIEELSLNRYAFIVNKKALKAKTSKRIKQLAQPRKQQIDKMS